MQTENKIHIVLHEPEIPQNTGNIARTCAVTGAVLHLIRPLGFEPDSAKLKRAGLDYWDKLDIRYWNSIEEFFENNSGTMLFFTTKSKRNYTDADMTGEVYLIFGKETKGLPESLIFSRPDECVRIPMRNELRCLNLSNAAAIAVYEALRQQGFEGMH